MSLCRKYLLLGKCKVLIEFLLTALVYRATIITNFGIVNEYMKLLLREVEGLAL
jgi:hypothetical protein